MPLFVLERDQIREIPQDDYCRFTSAHFGHKIHELAEADEDPHCPDSGDPMEVRFIKVTNGHEFLTLRRFRRSIAEALVYEVIPRQLNFAGFADPTKMIFGTPKRRGGRGANPQRRRECVISFYPGVDKRLSDLSAVLHYA